MANHNHDIHYMLIVLILAFFVITLSIGQINPGITGQAVKTVNSVGSEGFMIKFLRSTAQKSELNPVKADNLFSPIKIKTIKIQWNKILETKIPVANIGGRAVTRLSIQDDSLSTDGDCSWINLDNNDYRRLKSLTGNTACQKNGYTSCLMTNKVKTNSYYSSDDGSCVGLQFRDESNNFNNCDTRVKTVSACISGDVRESMHTTIFCCK